LTSVIILSLGRVGIIGSRPCQSHMRACIVGARIVALP
jgi:hypothetical protein